MAGIKTTGRLSAIFLATVMATAASAAVPGEKCMSAPVETASPVLPAAEVTSPGSNEKFSRDCPTSSETRADDEVCFYTPGMEKEKAPAWIWRSKKNKVW